MNWRAKSHAYWHPADGPRVVDPLNYKRWLLILFTGKPDEHTD